MLFDVLSFGSCGPDPDLDLGGPDGTMTGPCNEQIPTVDHDRDLAPGHVLLRRVGVEDCTAMLTETSMLNTLSKSLALLALLAGASACRGPLPPPDSDEQADDDPLADLPSP